MNLSELYMPAFIISVLLLLVILEMHVLTVLLGKRAGKWLGYTNILLHIAFVFALLFSGVTIEVMVLAFMTSVFVYTLVYYLKHTYAPDSVEGGSDDSDAAETAAHEAAPVPCDSGAEDEASGTEGEVANDL